MRAFLKSADFVLVLAASALLIGFGARFDFFCDDAFITLRYAENLAHHGEPNYNLGERVEGYTSFLWLLLSALGALLPVTLTSYVQVIGALSGVGIVLATSALLRRVAPETLVLRALVLLAVALSAPIAAWTMGGLETPLFAALTTYALALAIDMRALPTARSGAWLGLCLALATLTRPEGALVAAAVLGVLSFMLVRSRDGRIALLSAGGVAFAIVAAHLAWRWSYYGYPLPNTFYLKSSGDPAFMRARGGRYLGLALQELGLAFAALLTLSLLIASNAKDASAEGQATRLVTWIARILIPVYVLYVMTVGGDFLDLYRFFVPLLPLGFVLVAAALMRAAIGTRVPRAQLIACAIGAALVAWHGVHQQALADRARQVKEPERARRGIEPLGWTRLYALRWGAMGRWIAAHARKDDRMAVGAAGAMPYFARIHNLDTFGLCDAWVAHEAPIVSDRPGHQRFAPRSYILKHKPAFLLIGNDYARDAPESPRKDRSWERQGYVWAEAKVDAHAYGAPRTYYHYFLMRRDRAEERAPTSQHLRFHHGS
jgi:hypothetical protein